jgi:glycosyltransferase involved in cell wall biosynthesis
MKIFFLFPYPIGESPSQRFRFEQYLNLLQERGFHISYQSFWNEATWSILYKPGHQFRKAVGFLKGILRRVFVLFQLSKVDFVFIHRECLPVGPPLMEWVITHILKKKVIYDFDDAIWLPNTSKENKIVAYLKWHRKVASICRWSHKVSCGNSFLASYALQFNKNVIVNPTTIDTIHLHNPALFPPNERSGSVIIGWTGTHSTLPYIHSLVPIFTKLEEKYSGLVRVMIIANKDPNLGLPFVDFVWWSKETEMEDLLRMDIGVMPLHDDIWAKGKCGFKALQYMALEIPTIVSPVGANAEIVDHGVNGYLCEAEVEWLGCIEKLIKNAALRKEMGIAGRTKVINHYSLSSNSSTVLSLFL